MLRPKRLLSIFMTVMMMLTLCAGMTVTASAYTATGTMTTLYSSGNSASSGTYYSISTATELGYLSSYVNSGKNTSGVTFYLTSNITLNTTAATGPDNTQIPWTPIGGGASSYSFQGTFDGQNYTINNLNFPHENGN